MADDPIERYVATLFRVVLLISAVALAFGAYLLDGDATMAVLAVFFLVFVFLTRFKRFKGLGFEGELWEQEMEQAAKLRRGLEGLAEHLGKIVAWQVAPTWRSHVGAFERKLSIVESTTGILESIGISAQRIEEIKRPWHRSVQFELARPIVQSLSSIEAKKHDIIHRSLTAERDRRMTERPGIGEKTPKEVELETQMHSLQQAQRQQDHLIWRDDFENVPHLLRQFIEQLPWLAPEERQALYGDRAEEFLDIEQYARERTIRRPEILSRSPFWRG